MQWKKNTHSQGGGIIVDYNVYSSYTTKILRGFYVFELWTTWWHWPLVSLGLIPLTRNLIKIIQLLVSDFCINVCKLCLCMYIIWKILLNGKCLHLHHLVWFFIFLHKILVSFNDNDNWFDLVQSLFIITLKGRW